MFVIGECAAAVAGLWSCLDAVWVNDPDRDEAASRKMWQLKVASELGLRVPRTCMTNSPDRARQFLAEEPGSVVYKGFTATPETWRETVLVGETELEQLEQVRCSPVIFQEAIPVAATSASPSSAISCSRPRSSCPTAVTSTTSGSTAISRRSPPITLPETVNSSLLALMRRLDLWYGAIDLRRSPDGDYVFLEINPAGQWLFVEYATGQPISAALARLLADLDRRHLRAA